MEPVGKEREPLNRGLAQMFKNGVIMDVTTPEQAAIAEAAGACAVMALERVPADLRSMGAVARMSPPEMVERIMRAVSIPVMAKIRIGHFMEAHILETLGVDFIDESEVLTPADEEQHVDKHHFRVPFVCGARNLGEALRRIDEGASMIRTKGEAGTGNVVEAVRHMRAIGREIAALKSMDGTQLAAQAERFRVPLSLVEKTLEQERLPRVNFAAGGLATPADAALMMQLGCDGVFVGSGIFKSQRPRANRPGHGPGGNPLRQSRQVAGNFKGSWRAYGRSGNRGTGYTAGRAGRAMTVGLLGLQGAFRDHRKHLQRIGQTWRIVIDRDDLTAVDRLIIPGGESIVMAMYLTAYGLVEPLKARIEQGMPVWGICAGAILLARGVDEGPGLIGTLDMAVRRNAYGRHDASFILPLEIPSLHQTLFPAMFIRAPMITEIGPKITALAFRDESPVFVRRGSVMATTFHPELTDDSIFHDYFLGV